MEHARAIEELDAGAKATSITRSILPEILFPCATQCPCLLNNAVLSDGDRIDGHGELSAKNGGKRLHVQGVGARTGSYTWQ